MQTIFPSHEENMEQISQCVVVMLWKIYWYWNDDDKEKDDGGNNNRCNSDGGESDDSWNIWMIELIFFCKEVYGLNCFLKNKPSL